MDHKESWFESKGIPSAPLLIKNFMDYALRSTKRCVGQSKGQTHKQQRMFGMYASYPDSISNMTGLFGYSIYIWQVLYVNVVAASYSVAVSQ